MPMDDRRGWCDEDVEKHLSRFHSWEGELYSRGLTKEPQDKKISGLKLHEIIVYPDITTQIQ